MGLVYFNTTYKNISQVVLNHKMVLKATVAEAGYLPFSNIFLLYPTVGRYQSGLRMIGGRVREDTLYEKY